MDRAPGPLAPGRSRGDLVAAVARSLAEVPRGATVLIACSGGPDSTALAFLAAEARDDLRGVLVYVSHGLRGADVDRAEAGVVAQHAAWLGATFVRRDVAVVADGHGPEAAARTARHRALREESGSRRAVGVLLGHTADDQAETLLLRAARGTGPDGLAGMRERRGLLLRPLLGLRRADVHRFVELEGLPSVRDPMNDDPAVARVRVRREVLPVLAGIAPDPVGALGRLATLAADDAALLDDLAAKAVEQRRLGAVTALDRAGLAAAPVALARRAVRQAVGGLVGRPPSAATVARVLGAPVGCRQTLPGGLLLETTVDWSVLAPAGPARPVGRPLPCPGRAAWPAAGVAIEVSPAAGDGGGAAAPQAAPRLPLGLPSPPPPPPAGERGALPPGGRVDRLGLWVHHLVAPELRAPWPGARLGTATGRRRLVEVLREAGMPRAVRERWPVLVDEGRVVWVPGVAADVQALAAGRVDPRHAVRLVCEPGPVSPGADSH